MRGGLLLNQFTVPVPRLSAGPGPRRLLNLKDSFTSSGHSAQAQGPGVDRDTLSAATAMSGFLQGHPLLSGQPGSRVDPGNLDPAWQPRQSTQCAELAAAGNNPHES